MATFDEAVSSWRDTINEWYAIDATAVESGVHPTQGVPRCSG